MKTKNLLTTLVLILASYVLQAAPTMGFAFLYQGWLSDDGLNATGLYDFELTVYDVENGGTALGPTVTTNGVEVNNGLFTLTLDFGPSLFRDGTACWLEMRVRQSGSGLSHELLEPRQPLRPTPYATYARDAGYATSLSEILQSDYLDGTYEEELNFNNPANRYSGDGSGLTDLDASHLTMGAVPDARLSTYVARRNTANMFSGNQIVASGDVGIGLLVPEERLHVLGNVRAESFLGASVGTWDNRPLEFQLNGQRALRIEPSSDATEGSIPNFLGGWVNNVIRAGVVGAVVGGGGDPSEGSNPRPNQITDHYGVVAGGAGNRAGDGDATLGDAKYATVGGGYANEASGWVSTVAGGWYNRATYERATVAGGWNNLASSHAATVGGGRENRATNWNATVPGGFGNLAGGQCSFAAGRWANANHNGTFVWADFLDQDFTSTGPNQFLIRASGGVGIGTDNPQAALDVNGMIKARGGLTIETRTSDPASPVTGQIWLRTDL